MWSIERSSWTFKRAIIWSFNMKNNNIRNKKTNKLSLSFTRYIKLNWLNYQFSEWIQYEFRAAHLEALRNNYRHRLIVIMLGHPSLANLDADVLLWLKSCTCIHWGDKMFWQRLRFAMPELPFNRQHPQYLRYQTLTPHQSGKQKHGNLGANLLKSAGLLGGHSNNHNSNNHRVQQQQQLITSNSMHQPMSRPLPQPNIGNMMQSGEHHYAHLSPATMIYNQQQQQQQQHTYHQPIYGDPSQQLQQQQQQSQQRDNPTVPVHI